jgi:hypothetical protein
MLRVGIKSFIVLFVLFALFTCIEPYSPELKGYESLLVVDGLITDENSAYTISLSRTMQEQDGMPVKISDATLFISDENDNDTYLMNIGKGLYKTDSLEFKGIVGKTYVLHIITSEGNEYQSEPCTMKSVPEIDSIYYAKDQELINNGTESQVGIRIYIDSNGEDINRYYRWDFEETWKFRVPTPKKFNYINDSTFEPVLNVNEYCWKTRKSDEILIRSLYAGQEGRIESEPIFFIAPEKSERLLIQYSILVKQYSISKKEFDFWDNLKRVNESGGDIFATQPFSVISNVHNVKNPKEQVLGYFQVSAVKHKRKTIPFSEIVGLNLPYYNNKCERIEMAPEDIPMPQFGEPLTWDDLYRIYCITSDFYFVEPKFISGTQELEKLVFARPECSDCAITGTLTKPDFWVDSD